MARRPHVARATEHRGREEERGAMENGMQEAVWAAVGRATEQVGGTRVASFLGESYTLPDVTWEHFPTALATELGPGWEVTAGGEADPFCIVVQSPQQTFLLRSTRVTSHDGVTRHLVLEVE